MQKTALRKTLVWAVIVSETSHVFCCILPILFSLAGLLAGMGMAAALPAGVIAFHEVMHKWEVPLIVFSGTVLVLGWAALWYADRVDCHDTGCTHPHSACVKGKSSANLILKIATGLFLFNIIVYVAVHRADWFEQSAAGRVLSADETHAAD